MADLAPRVEGRTVEAVALNWTGCLDHPTAADFLSALKGERIEKVRRRGKYLLFDLSSGHTLLIHLGMTGRLYVPVPDSSPDAYCTAFFRLDSGAEMRLTDPRKFGHIWLVEDASAVVGKLGPDALDESIGPADLEEMLRRRKGARIKAVLLDQSFLAGIGNIYADESLFEAGIHPSRAAGSLSSQEVERLRCGILVVLRRAIDNRGTTFSDYRDGFGRPGKNQQALAVFHRTGQPCPRCATPIQRTIVVGRGTHFCPICQPV